MLKACSSCAEGENKVPADYLVEYYVWANNDNDSKLYRKAWLCNDHLDMVNDDCVLQKLPLARIAKEQKISEAEYEAFCEV